MYYNEMHQENSMFLFSLDLSFLKVILHLLFYVDLPSNSQSSFSNFTSFISEMNAPDRFELFILPEGVKKFATYIPLADLQSNPRTRQ